MTILSDVCIFIENRWSLLLGTKVVLFLLLTDKTKDYLCIFATEIRYGTFMSLHRLSVSLNLCDFV